MEYGEFRETCRTAWSETFNYLCTDMTKNKKECKYRIFNENKKHIMNATLPVKLFTFSDYVLN